MEGSRKNKQEAGTTDDLTQVLEVINAEGDTGEIADILEQDSKQKENSKTE